MAMFKPVVIVQCEGTPTIFEERCTAEIDAGYMLMSVNCSFDPATHRGIYQAIFVRPSAMPPKKMQR